MMQPYNQESVFSFPFSVNETSELLRHYFPSCLYNRLHSVINESVAVETDGRVVKGLMDGRMCCLQVCS